MKKCLSLLAITAITVNATSAFAQGTITFNNSDTSLVRRWASEVDQTLIPVPAGGGFVQLAYAPLQVPLSFYTPFESQVSWLARNPGWRLSEAVAITSPGKFNGGTFTLEGVPAGGTARYGIFAWTGSETSFDQAAADGEFLGVHGLLELFGGVTTPTGGAGSPVPLTDTFIGMNIPISTIPEPSTVVLAGLGATALLIFRRRQ